MEAAQCYFQFLQCMFLRLLCNIGVGRDNKHLWVSRSGQRRGENREEEEEKGEEALDRRALEDAGGYQAHVVGV